MTRDFVPPPTLGHAYVARAASHDAETHKHVKGVFMHIIFPRRYGSTSRRGTIAHLGI